MTIVSEFKECPLCKYDRMFYEYDDVSKTNSYFCSSCGHGMTFDENWNSKVPRNEFSKDCFFKYPALKGFMNPQGFGLLGVYEIFPDVDKNSKQIKWKAYIYMRDVISDSFCTAQDKRRMDVQTGDAEPVDVVLFGEFETFKEAREKIEEKTRVKRVDLC
jgi:hypothetical protein